MLSNSPYVFINGKPEKSIFWNDRALAYGDGLFETIRLSSGKLTFLQLHLSRLYNGCKILDIPLSASTLQQEIDKFIYELANTDGIIKIIVTRGYSTCGYNPNNCKQPNRILAFMPLSAAYKNKTAKPAIIGLSSFILQPDYFAKVKHLNKLVQVMASAECHKLQLDETLLVNNLGNFIEGTCSNLFVVTENQQILTPELTNYGVAGVCREWLLSNSSKLGLNIKVDTLKNLAAVNEIFICNSVFGVWPVAKMDNIAYSLGKTSKFIKDVIDNELKI